MNDLMLHRAAQLLEAEFGPQVSNDSIVFETENTIYHLVHTPETVSEVMCA